MVFFRSLLAPFFLLIPLILAVVIWLPLMKLLGIEINSNIACGASVAMGVGIDAGVYLVYRFREEFSKSKDFIEALGCTFSTTGKALIFSFLSLILGLWALSPIPLYVGYVGFGLGLVLLLCFLFTFLSPVLVWNLVRPKFLFGNKSR
jgi:hypothetical protein